MKLENWLKRKYPNHCKELAEKFENKELEYLKNFKYKVGRLLKDSGENKVGDLCLFKRVKEYIEENENGYEYPNEGGWSGQFEYAFIYQKPSNHWCTKSYSLNCEEI